MNYQEVHEKAKQFTGLSEELDKRVMRMADITWGVIGGDVLECGEQDYMKRSDVIEVVSDADYMFTYGRDPEAYAYFLYLVMNNRKHLDKIMKKAFPYARYGY